MPLLAPLLALFLAAQPPALEDVVVSGTLEQARALIASGTDVNERDTEGVTALMHAASAGRGDMVRLLLANGADPRARTNGGVDALMMASLGGYMDAVAPLLAAKVDVTAKDNQGRTALMAAASSGEAAAVVALVEAGADVKAEDASGGTALTYAAAEGQAAAVDALRRHGATPREMELILAAGRCNTAIVRSFVDSGMALQTTQSGTTPVVAAAGGNCPETVELLLERGADVNATNSDGWTPLMKASAAGHAEVVKILLARGADMNVADSSGRTAWMYAAMANREDIAAMFREARAAANLPAVIAVSSPAFGENEAMPREYTADGRNVSPPLVWSNIPERTQSIAIVCEDPDAGNPPPFVHWVMYNVPATAGGLPENVPFTADAPMPAEIAGAVQGLSGFRRPFYRGPAPPPGNPHHYHFIVYALDTADLPAGLNRAELLEAMDGHVIGRGELVAIYERKP